MHKVNDLFPTTLSNLAYVQKRNAVGNIFPQLGNRNDEDRKFLHNLLINTEISINFLGQNSLQPVLVN
jgi:hypothetical protein